MGTAWLVTLRLAILYMEPVLMGLTRIDPDPLARSAPGLARALSETVEVMVQPCCQPSYS